MRVQVEHVRNLEEDVSVVPRKPEREKEFIVQSKAELRCEGKDSLPLSVLVRLRKRLLRNNVGVCQIVTRFSADCLDSYRKVGAKISGSVE